LLHVGPRSAGAVPGPACYGRGGTLPTIADANLLLGRLNPDYFLGGEIPLDAEASRLAVENHCAHHLGLDSTSTSMGILDIANATMADAIRLISVQRGHDPRDFCLIATGGAGPMHANHLALEIGIPAIIIPPSPGVASALGMLTSDIRHDYCLTHLQELESADLSEMNSIFGQLRERGTKSLNDDGIKVNAQQFGRYVDMRYVGQSWKLRIPITDRDLQRIDLRGVKRSFDVQHNRAYGYSCPDEPAEVVNVGVLAIGDLPRLHLKTVGQGSKSPGEAKKGERPVYFQEEGKFIQTPVFNRYLLRAKNFINGPAIIEEMDSTTVIHPDSVAEVIQFGILVIRRKP
jgi:N-methylhydantoinase A